MKRKWILVLGVIFLTTTAYSATTQMSINVTRDNYDIYKYDKKLNVEHFNYNGDEYVKLSDMAKELDLKLIKSEKESRYIVTADNGNEVYTGSYLDGLYHGKGKLIYRDGGIYEGEFRKGFREGTGTMIYQNGERYEGQWIDNKKSGTGKYFWTNMEKYEGEFEADYIHGKGKKFLINGDYYDGEWSYGQMNGIGTYRWVNGDRYEGNWVYGFRNGKGKFTKAEGYKQQGLWKDNVFYKYLGDQDYSDEEYIIK